MTREILFGEEGREKLMKGVDKLSNAVKTTLGAKGKNVIIGTDFGSPKITKDGVTVAKSIMIHDEVENMGASLVRDVASKTADIAGDGTTTATVLAQAILALGIPAINKGINQVALKSGIDKATKSVVESLKKMSLEIEGPDQLLNIASISANNDPEIGRIIAEAVSFVGKDGSITVEQSGDAFTKVEKVAGLKINQGYIDPKFAYNCENEKVVMDNPFILMYDKKITTMVEVMPLLIKVQEAKRPILIICEDMAGEALPSLIVNNLNGRLNVCVVKAPGYGKNRYDMMRDMELVTGGIMVSEDIGIDLKDAAINNLGSAERVIITSKDTVIIGGNSNKDLLEERIQNLKKEIENPKDNDVRFLKHRLGNITDGLALITVGGITEIEVKEKLDRIDDALCATISSLEEGYVAGGGVAYLNCLGALDLLEFSSEAESIGIEIIRQAIQVPHFQINENAGIVVTTDSIAKIISQEYGFGTNVKTGKFENLIENGIIDPTKVERVALENAASIAGIFLTTDCIISNVSEEY